MLPPTICSPASTPSYSHPEGARPDVLAGSGRLDSPVATTSSVTTNDDHGRGRWGNPDDAEPTPTASSPTGHLPWCHPTACLPGQHIADLGPVPGTGVNTPVRITAICNLDAPVLVIPDVVIDSPEAQPWTPTPAPSRPTRPQGRGHHDDPHHPRARGPNREQQG